MATLCAIETRTIENDTFGKVYIHALVINPSENAGFGMIDNPPAQKGNAYASAHFVPGQHAMIINGGYFDANFHPDGYCKIDGQVVSAQVNPKLSGYVVISPEGALDLLEKNASIEGYRDVMQSGPFIIDPGGKVGIYSPSGDANKRTVIAKENDGTLLILTTSGVRLFELAKILREEFPDIERALNLDGGPSTAVITDKLRMNNLNPVRNFIIKKHE